MLALTALAHDRSLPQAVVLDAMQVALEHAYKKDSNGQDVRVDIDLESGDQVVRTIRTVAEDIEDEVTQISLSEAKKHYPDINVGEEITTGYMDPDPGRITAQSSRQLLLQKLREAERKLVADEYSDRIGEIMTGTVQRIEGRDVIVSLGRGEALMPIQEQVSAEKYRVGQQLKFIIAKLDQDRRGPEVIVSRANVDLLKGLFELEVPEISSGVILIKHMVREAGSRSKIAVHSTQEGVDAVGACVGLRGLRIQNVVNELLGEKIDVIQWSEDPVEFIIKSLSPSDVESVKLNASDKSAKVAVPEHQLSLAIGKDGQNVRLAAKLSGWKVDILSDKASLTEASGEKVKNGNSELSKIGITSNTEEILKVGSIATVKEISTMSDENLLAISGMTKKRLEEVRLLIPSVIPMVSTEITNQVPSNEQDEKLAQKIVTEEDVFSQKDLDEIIAVNEDKPEEKKVTPEVTQDDIWNIDKIVKKKSKKPQKGVIRFAEDIEDLRK
ncbi:transcription termination factor NusA [Dehalococcoidia bacterium]|nr:transcription termination factor NusA [Dehalococcoidia bacterium]